MLLVPCVWWTDALYTLRTMFIYLQGICEAVVRSNIALHRHQYKGLPSCGQGTISNPGADDIISLWPKCSPGYLNKNKPHFPKTLSATGSADTARHDQRSAGPKLAKRGSGEQACHLRGTHPLRFLTNGNCPPPPPYL